MSKDAEEIQQDKNAKRKYENPQILEEEELERQVLITCGKVFPG